MKNQENGLTVTNCGPSFFPPAFREEALLPKRGIRETPAGPLGVGAGTGACGTHPFSEWGPGILSGGGGSRSSCSSTTKGTQRFRYIVG